MLVLVGLDGTCCDSSWRRPSIEEKGWDHYHSLLAGDEPICHIRDLVDSLYEAGHTVVAVTSRSEKWRGSTLGWLVKNAFSFHELMMRKVGDFRTEAEVKTSALPMSSRTLVIDDSAAVIAAFRARGATCLQVER